MKTNKLLVLLMCALLLITLVTGTAFAEAVTEAETEDEAYFTQWNPDAPALDALVDYVEAKDLQAFTELMRHHIDESKRNCLAALAEQQRHQNRD